MSKHTTQTASLLLALVLIISSYSPTIAYANTSTSHFTNMPLLEELTSSSIKGQPFNLANYPFDENRDLQIINFVEYCYSFRTNMRSNYALFIYIYNPKCLDLEETSMQNKVQMASSYNNSTPTKYTKFNLEFCSKTDSPNYKNLFYKFKIVDKPINGKTFCERVDSHARQYDISGIELLTRGNKNSTEYKVGGSYIFSGYSKGYGPDINAESSLSCNVKNTETVTVDVFHTNYKTNVSSIGKDHYNEVNSLYFSLPERIFETYGNLQKIRAEWWEYKTQMSVITSNKNFYNELLPYTKTNVGTYNPNVPIWLYSGYEGQISSGIGIPTIHTYYWAYNVDMSTKYTSFDTPSEISSYEKLSSIIPIAFYAPEVNSDSVFDFLYSDPIAGSVNSTQVKEWIYNYSNDLGNGFIDCNGRNISKDLFEDHVDEGRTMGYNNKNIDLSDTFNLKSYDSTHSWWDKLWDYGFSWPATNGDYLDVAPIYEVKPSDFSKNYTSIANNLLVNINNIQSLKEFYDNQTATGNRVILFRFANTDYYCAPAFTPYVSYLPNTDTYVAQQTVFFDFDVIELTFNKDGNYYVIPAVSNPSDIINGFTQPPSQLEWGIIILIVILLVLLLIILWPIMPYIIEGAIWIVCLPFTIIKSIHNSIKSKKQTKQIDEIYENIRRKR